MKEKQVSNAAFNADSTSLLALFFLKDYNVGLEKIKTI